MRPLFVRNDDVDVLTPGLRRFTDLFLEHDVPLLHSVIPARATPEVAAWLVRLAEETGRVEIGLHGWDHELFGNLPEFGPHVPRAVQQEHVARSWNWAEAHLGKWFSGIFVPPHNCYNRTTVECLDRLGFRGLSGATRPLGRARAMAEPLLYHLGRGELCARNGRPFPGSRIVQCSATVDPVPNYHAGAIVDVADILAQLGAGRGPFEGICLHHVLFEQGQGFEWLRTFLREIRGCHVVRMSTVMAALW